jgi:hypothetical protein
VTIYSPMPPEKIYAGMQKDAEPFQEILVNGVIMQIQPINPTQAKIVRIISPNPQDYLNPAYAPGQVIRFNPDL